MYTSYAGALARRIAANAPHLRRLGTPVLSSTVTWTARPNTRPRTDRHLRKDLSYTALSRDSHDESEADDSEEDKSTDSAIAANRFNLPAYLRPYQVEAIESCMDALSRGVRRMGVSSPTGSGKTVML